MAEGKKRRGGLLAAALVMYLCADPAPFLCAAPAPFLFAGPAFAAKHAKTAAATETPVTQGGGFLEQCGDKGDRELSCFAFTAGLYEGITALQSQLLMQKLPSPDEYKVLMTGEKAAAQEAYRSLARRYAAFCPPAGLASYGNLRGMLADFIRDNPSARDMRTADVFLAALGKAYPCERTEAPTAPASPDIAAPPAQGPEKPAH